MRISSLPFVSILTPVYNGEKYLKECVESVLAQTFQNWEYIIVNNCSTDRSLEIAEHYAQKDSRIRVLTNTNFVGVIENHNIAFSLISPQSKYCKVVSADDWLFQECISRMVEFAESNPSVGIIGSYQLSGSDVKWEVKWVGLPYSSATISGQEVCRWRLLGGPYVFGTPTSSLYKSDLVRETDSFFPGVTRHADTSACYKHLQNMDFGFVHQVLSFERVHQDAQSTEVRRLDGFRAAYLEGLLDYGPIYLSKGELEKRLDEVLSDYYSFLAISAVSFQNKEFWVHHKRFLEGKGYSLFSIRLAKAVCVKLLDLLFNPKHTIEKLLSRFNESRGLPRFGQHPELLTRSALRTPPESESAR